MLTSETTPRMPNSRMIASVNVTFVNSATMPLTVPVVWLSSPVLIVWLTAMAVFTVRFMTIMASTHSIRSLPVIVATLLTLTNRLATNRLVTLHSARRKHDSRHGNVKAMTASNMSFAARPPFTGRSPLLCPSSRSLVGRSNSITAAELT